MTAIFDPLAKSKYEGASEYYEAQEEGLGEKFRRAVWAAVAILERYPGSAKKCAPESAKSSSGDFRVS